MKTNTVIEPVRSTLILVSNGEACWFEISPGIRPNGSAYDVTDDKFPVDLTVFGDDDKRNREEFAKQVRAVYARTPFERVASDLVEDHLPKGFAL